MEEEHNGEWKTLSVHNDIYKMIQEKQKELIKNNKGKHIQLSYVTESAILLGIDEVI